MDKNISEIFDYGEGIVIVEERDDLFDPAQIKELTMEKIHSESNKIISVRRIVQKTRSARRSALIAAVVAVLLAGTAFAVYQFGLKDMLLSERHDGLVDVSVLGWRDTPEYQAYMEWNAYKDEYNSTHEIPNIDDPDISVSYLRVGAWSKEMVEQLDAILDEYSLSMHDDIFISLPAEGSGIDLDAILPEEEDHASGYAYADGTIKLDGSHGGTIDYELFSAVKGTFTNVNASADSECEEWTYTAADGTEVKCILGEQKSMIVADMDRVFVTMHTVFGNASDRAELEELADSIGWKALNDYRGFTDEYYTEYMG